MLCKAAGAAIALNAALSTGLGGSLISNASQTPHEPLIQTGSVADGDSSFVFITGFETTDSPAYAQGALAIDGDSGQNGWHIWNLFSQPPAPGGAADSTSSVAAVVSGSNAAAGSQHIRIRNDPALATNASVGVISPLLAPSATSQTSISGDVYISVSGDGQFNWRPRDTAGSDTVAVNVVFAPADMMIGQTLTTAGMNFLEIAEKNAGNNPLLPDICVLERNTSNALVFKCIADWNPAAYRCFEVSVLPPLSGNPAAIEYRYGIRSASGVCPLIHSDDQLVNSDNVDSVHFRHNNRPNGVGFMDIDNLSIEIALLPGACCDGSNCSEIPGDQCNLANGDLFLGAGTSCEDSLCTMGRCCASNGACSYTSAAGCTGTFFGGYPSDICNINCCEQPTEGGATCDDLTAIPTIPVPGVANFDGLPSPDDPVDCPILIPDVEYHWEAFTITECAKVEISYCCSGEAVGAVRSPGANFIIQDSGPLGGCPCDGATVLFAPDDTNVDFGGTLPDKCTDFGLGVNFDMMFLNLQPGTYYIPIFIQDNDPMAPTLVNTLDYQMQVETFDCPVGGCCTSNICTYTDEVACTNGNGIYQGEGVNCEFLCPGGGTPCPGGIGDCRNDAPDNACNQVWCTTVCEYYCIRYGDVFVGDEAINLDDIICALSGFSNYLNCPDADIAPCAANGIINLDDILSVIDAFSTGANPCGCTENSVPGGGFAPPCGSHEP